MCVASLEPNTIRGNFANHAHLLFTTLLFTQIFQNSFQKLFLIKLEKIILIQLVHFKLTFQNANHR